MSVAIKIKPGIIDRLRETRGIGSEEAFARLIQTDRSTLRRIDAGGQPSGSFMAGFCDAFGLGLGEAFDVVTSEVLAKAA
ncbi:MULTISPECIES: helix-turn-helix transcriptional regulator [unclassified Cryobacterium]|uniref:helix-turn-helix domain-containing protein n=1 Tax=unclassified Cryobacterium TaxID=2649013 RepID=UPI002AB42031|nr:MULTISPECIES: helix-turn-helix transcriptional regulator [unclassified Cryobacterium]MDY7542653.1 helix-turn-helix transcriptional regulator [Cryobacterium sp. 5B3]MEB0264774.1 helix-turn-helix transcriptional regulator [Cryobacterium sp. 10I5]MEB0273746.1 helix-turn-helix transcriptional regulator [Cryobacterium sp. 5B3]